MKKLLLSSILSLLILTQINAQDTVTLTVTDYYINGDNWNGDGVSGDPEMSLRYIFYRSLTTSPFAQIYGSQLIERNTPVTNQWFQMLVANPPSFSPPFINPKYTMVMPNKNQLKIKLEGWEDDCGARDEFNTSCTNDDDDYLDWNLDSNNNVFNYKNNPPETYFTYITNNCGSGEDCFRIEGQVKYNFPPISNPIRVAGSGVLCPNQSLKLRTDFAAKKTGVKFQWQYDIKNANDTSLPVWKDILTTPTNYTTDSTITIGNLSAKFPELDTASRTKKLYTRVRAFTNLGGEIIRH